MKKRSGDSSRMGDVSEMLMQKPPLGTPLDWENPLNDGCVMHLAMNDGHGDKVQDLSLNGNHGTLNNFAFPPIVDSGWNPGQTGIGLICDGVDDYIDCGNAASLSPTKGITLSLLIKYGADPTTFNGMMLDSTAYSLYSRSISSEIQLLIGGDEACIPFSEIDETRWFNIVGTYDSSNLKIYYNGNLIDVVPSVAAIPAVVDVCVGARKPLILPFKGGIDQPRIQSRAWSAKEVRDYSINPWRVYEQ